MSVRNTSSRVGRDRLIALIVMPAPSSVRSSTGSASSPWSTVSRSAPSATVISRTTGESASSDRAASVAPLTDKVTTSPEMRRLSSSGVPTATMTPWSMTNSRSHSASASSR